MVLFSAVFSCFLLDSFELQEMVQFSHKTRSNFLSLLDISRRTYRSGYDEQACDTIFFPNAGN